MTRITRPTIKRKIPEKLLPGGAEIELYTSFTVGEEVEVMKIQDDESITHTEKAIKTLIYAIKSWNITDNDDNILPITEDNIKLLPNLAVPDLITHFYEKTPETNAEKKDGTNTPTSA